MGVSFTWAVPVVPFTLSDDETISRISKLYSKSKTTEIAARWR